MPVRNPLKNAKRRKGQIAVAKQSGVLPKTNYIETELKAKRNTIRHALNRMRLLNKREWASDPNIIPNLRKDLKRYLEIKKKRKLDPLEQKFADRIKLEILNEIKIRNKKVKLPQ